MALVDSTGAIVAEYSYDPYGNILSATNGTDSTIGDLNPLRYRSYVYDTESTLYYLQSRYYDPEIGRFINADAYASTGQGVLGNNMFAYCGNNPVNKADSAGMIWEWVVGLGIAIALLVSGCATSVSNDAVLVISSAEWETGSQQMEKDLSDALGTDTSDTVVIANNESFVECWNSTTANYVVIHTHGSPTTITDNNDFSFKVTHSDQLSRNENIEYVIITACSVGGPVENGYNMGQTLSTKISPTGYVICSTTTVSGGDTSFRPLHNGQWVVYQNGQVVASSIQTRITMECIANYINTELK